jgi:hypothetical protein
VLAENQELWMSEKAQCAEKLKDIEDMNEYRRAMGKCISPVDTRLHKVAAEMLEFIWNALLLLLPLTMLKNRGLVGSENLSDPLVRM